MNPPYPSFDAFPFSPTLNDEVAMERRYAYDEDVGKEGGSEGGGGGGGGGGKTPASGKAGKQHEPPLKRGSACTRCRRRKLKCDASKPLCVNCVKMGHECIYDVGKPRSRVKALEAQIAELQNKLTSTTSPNSNPAPPPPPIQPAPEFTLEDTRYPPLGPVDDYDYPHSQNLTVLDLAAAAALAPHMPLLGESSGPGRREEEDLGRHDPGNFDFLDPILQEASKSYHNMPVGNSGPVSAPSPLSISNLMNSAQANGGAGYPPNEPGSAMNTSFVRSTSDEDTPFGRGGGGGNGDSRGIFGGYEGGPPPLVGHRSSDGGGGGGGYGQGYIQEIRSGPGSSSSTPAVGAGPQGNNNGEFGSFPYPQMSNPKGYQSTFEMMSGFDFSLLDAGTHGGAQGAQSSGLTPFASTSASGSHGPTPSSTAVGDPIIAIDPCIDNAEARRSRIITSQAMRTVPDGLKDEDEDGVFGTALTSGWFDSTDLPAYARDRLLDLFFSKARQIPVDFNIAKFYAKLTLPPARRPHPCMLYSMYLIAARWSDEPSISALEGHFYKVATEQFDVAVTTADRLLDAIRGGTLISVYLYSMSRYHEAWVSVGRVTRLALSAGLHCIKSSVPEHQEKELYNHAGFKNLKVANGPFTRREKTWVLPPTMDRDEIGERISAFWYVHFIDRAGAIATSWPPAIDTKIISTPLPRLHSDYETGFLTKADDRFLGDLFGDKASEPAYRAHPLQMKNKIMELLHQCANLVYLAPEPGIVLPEDSTTPGESPAFTPGNSPGEENYRWWLTAKYRTPSAFQRLDQALKNMQAGLPPSLLNPMQTTEGHGKVNLDAIILNTYFSCANMYLYDVDDYRCENREALAAARRCLVMIHAIPDDMFQELEIFMAMLWSFLCRVLIKESERLVRRGETFGAASVQIEIDVVIRALTRLGKIFGIAQTQAAQMQMWRAGAVPDE